MIRIVMRLIVAYRQLRISIILIYKQEYCLLKKHDKKHDKRLENCKIDSEKY